MSALGRCAAHTIKPDGTRLRQFTRSAVDPSMRIAQPRWTPDGTRIMVGIGLTPPGSASVNDVQLAIIDATDPAGAEPVLFSPTIHGSYPTCDRRPDDRRGQGQLRSPTPSGCQWTVSPPDMWRMAPSLLPFRSLSIVNAQTNCPVAVQGDLGPGAVVGTVGVQLRGRAAERGAAVRLDLDIAKRVLVGDQGRVVARVDRIGLGLGVDRPIG